MRVLKALVIAVVLGGGFGLAALGKWKRACLWNAAMLAGIILGTLLSPWIVLVVVPVALVGLHVDTFLVAFRPDTRLRWASLPPWLVLAGTVFASLFVRVLVVEAFKIPSSGQYPTLQIGDHVFIDKLSLLWRAPERGDLIVHMHPCAPERDYVKRVVAVAGDTVEVRCNVLYVNGKAVPSTLIEDGEHCSYQDLVDYGYGPQQWQKRACSRYRETLDGHTYEVFHDPERPQRDAELAQGKLDHGDMRDFPQLGGLAPSCAMTPEVFGHAPPSHEIVGKVVETKSTDATPCEPQRQYVVPAGTVFVLGDNRSNSADSRVWGVVPLSLVKGRVTTIWWSRHLSRIGAVH